MKIVFLILSLVVGDIQNLAAVILTHYGYEAPGTPNYDPQSAAGQGSFGFDTQPGSLQNINASGVTAAALSPDVVRQYNLSPGQQFTVTANGQTYNLVYADNTRADLTGRIDFYDPNGTFQASGAQVTALNGGAIIEGGDSGLLAAAAPAAATSVIDQNVIDPLIHLFSDTSSKWAAPLIKGVNSLFWLLVLISLVWQGGQLLLRGTTLNEIFYVLVFQFILPTGAFFWFLQNGPMLAQAVINSLRQLGGQASGTGQQIAPAELVNIAMQLVNPKTNWISFLIPSAAILPSFIGIIVLLTCLWITGQLMIQLISAYVLSFAGVVVLGFGGSPWSRDIAINFFRTCIGVGLSLFTLELLINVGVQFLNQLVASLGGFGAITSIGQLLVLTVASVILAMICTKIPAMIAGMVTGSGHHGGLGAVGVGAMVASAIAAARMASSVTGAAGAAGAAGMSASDQLQARIAAAAETTSAGHSNGNGASYPSSNGSSRMNSTVPSSSTPSPRAPTPTSPPPSAVPSTTAPVIVESPSILADEPVAEQPILPDESRGYESPPFFYPDEPV